MNDCRYIRYEYKYKYLKYMFMYVCVQDRSKLELIAVSCVLNERELDVHTQTGHMIL